MGTVGLPRAEVLATGIQVWNPWHGCHKISPGCQNCYMFRRDAEFEKDSTQVRKTASFSLPVQRRRDGGYKLAQAGRVYACMSSDFFVEEADEWRAEAWRMIRERRDLPFCIVTKRIERFFASLPDDWGGGYENVTLCATCENQAMADKRLPVLLELPLRHREIIHEPMLEAVEIERYLASGKIEHVTCGGESGDEARVCDYAWVLHTRAQCEKYRVPFYFKQTGARFQMNGKLYFIPRKRQMEQARRANINLPAR